MVARRRGTWRLSGPGGAWVGGNWQEAGLHDPEQAGCAKPRRGDGSAWTGAATGRVELPAVRGGHAQRRVDALQHLPDGRHRSAPRPVLPVRGLPAQLRQLRVGAVKHLSGRRGFPEPTAEPTLDACKPAVEFLPVHPSFFLRGLLPDLAASPAEVALTRPGAHAAALLLAPPALPVTDRAESLASALRTQLPAGMRLQQRLWVRPPLAFWALVHEVVIRHPPRRQRPPEVRPACAPRELAFSRPLPKRTRE